jgi:hypothetical protein
MTMLLAILGFAFAAICVWFGVRLVNRRQRWAKRLTVALVVVLVGYPLSIGPADLVIRTTQSRWLREAGDIACRPLGSACWKSDTATHMLFWYDGLWVNWRRDQRLHLPPGLEVPLLQIDP